MMPERLVVVSNRLPEMETDSRAEGNEQPSVGGLVGAIRPALEGFGGAIWLGWSGRSLPAARAGGLTEQVIGGTNLIGLDLPETEFNAYYNGFCNRALWPLCHSMPNRVKLSRTEERAYRKVNHRFAQVLAPRLSHEDLVWVQDYHLIPLGTELRHLGWKGRTGFFLHIPFPPYEIWSILPDPAYFLDSLMDYDVVGFHTETYRENYIRACGRTLGATWDGSWLTLNDRRQRVGVFPIGIEPDRYASSEGRRSGRQPGIRRLTGFAGVRLILGVDRLDYTKGIPERMSAMDVLFRNHPELRRRVSLVQLCAPSRTRVPEYIEQKRLVETAVGHVNGEWGDPEWTPISYILRTYPVSEVVRLYRDADVCLVTPLRDGMNLVAKEFVAAQDPESPGVLVLSRFAGVAEELTDAVIVNPYSAEGTADGIARALQMGQQERRERHAKSLAKVLERPSHKWAEEFIQTMRTPQISFSPSYLDS
jgi:trehalose 6-phosphate synthase